MQRIFIVHSDYTVSENVPGTFNAVNDFLGDTGFIISVTPQTVHNTTSGSNLCEDGRGRWLVVADNGKGVQL